MTANDRAKKLFGENYLTIPVSSVNEENAHGNALSVKIVLPTWCQANCSFCFNKLNKAKQTHSVYWFLTNLRDSLNILKKSLPTRKITLDLTGNEPTFDPGLLKDVLSMIEGFDFDMVSKVVLTTNGYNLSKFDSLAPVDIVNISLHHFDFEERKKIFKTANIPNDEELAELCKRFNVTAVAVFDETREDLESFTKKFAAWAKGIGFKNARIRTNYLSKGSVFFDAFKEVGFEEYPGLCTKEVTIDGFNVKLYRGIEDLTTCIFGTEVVIDDDGKIYLDYYKRYPLISTEIKEFDSNMYVKPKNE